MTLTRRTLLVLLAALALAGPAARAQAVPVPVSPLKARVMARNGRLVAALDVSPVFGPDRERAFGNGLTNVVALYVTVTPEAGGTPVAFHGRVVEILFDVWDETYAVTLKDPDFPAGRRLVLPDFAALRSYLSDQRELDLGPLSALPVGPFVVEARLEVNPVSREQLQRTREYIASAAGNRPGGGSRSVLGAVASFLLREPDPGTDVHLLRSRAFSHAEVQPR
ncbi:MAG: hypothetical protein QM767_08025 [Anaeromyxobacter sp.]